MQVWQMNSSWERVSSQNIGTLSSAAALAQETVFGVDANGNGTIGNPNSLSLTGTSGNDTLIGGANNDVLTGLGGKDRFTGGLGSDRFVYQTLTDSLLANFDVITDFNATTDRFLVGTTRSGFNNVGTVTSLDNAGISTTLTPVNFGVHSAAGFTFGSRTFVAINDATAGFNETTDAIIEITGLTGTLGLGNFVTV
jgi:Ca2+-binding RTX toxin-like protein